jgi:hypothetical protein
MPRPTMKVYEVVIKGFVLAENDLPHPEGWGWESIDRRVTLDFVGFPDIEITKEGMDVWENHSATALWAGPGFIPRTLEAIDGEAQEIHPIKTWDKKGNVKWCCSYQELKPVYDKVVLGIPYRECDASASI